MTFSCPLSKSHDCRWLRLRLRLRLGGTSFNAVHSGNDFWAGTPSPSECGLDLNPLRYLVTPLRWRVATGGALQTFLSALTVFTELNGPFQNHGNLEEVVQPKLSPYQKKAPFSTNYFWAFIMIDHSPLPISPSPLISQWAPRVHQVRKVKRPYLVPIIPKADGFKACLLSPYFVSRAPRSSTWSHSYLEYSKCGPLRVGEPTVL